MKAGMRTRRMPQSAVLLCVALVILNISRAAVARETSEQDADLGISSKSTEDGAAVRPSEAAAALAAEIHAELLTAALNEAPGAPAQNASAPEAATEEPSSTDIMVAPPPGAAFDSHNFPWMFGNQGDSGSTTMKLINLGAKHPKARCLDGSPSFMFYSEANVAGRNKWLIYHTVGGWCTSITDCCKRATDPMLGSSKRLSSYMDMMPPGWDARLSFPAKGYLARDRQQNPTLHDRNVIFMPYCDGGSWSGAKEEPLTGVCNEAAGEPAELHFRGSHTIDAAIEEMHELGIGNATDVLVAGGSAGGLSVFYHADKYADAIPNAEVRALSDSSMFMDFDSDAQSLFSSIHPGSLDALGRVRRDDSSVPGRTAQQLQWVYYMMNSTAGLDQSCVDYYQGDKGGGAAWKCMFPQYAARFVETPTFVLQSIFDWWQVAYSLAVSDFTGQITNNFGELIKRTTLSALEGTKHAAFIDACVHHTSINMWADSVQIDGWTQAQAFESFMRGEERRTWVTERADYFNPCNMCCSQQCILDCKKNDDGTVLMGGRTHTVKPLPYFPFYELKSVSKLKLHIPDVAIGLMVGTCACALVVLLIAKRSLLRTTGAPTRGTASYAKVVDEDADAATSSIQTRSGSDGSCLLEMHQTRDPKRRGADTCV